MIIKILILVNTVDSINRDMNDPHFLQRTTKKYVQKNEEGILYCINKTSIYIIIIITNQAKKLHLNVICIQIKHIQSVCYYQ